MRTPDVSIVVATCNRAGLLPRLVAALESQDAPEMAFEVVVVDDASTDDTGMVLAALADRTTLDLHTVRAPHNLGPAGARNLGVGLARGRTIAFTDDDCTPTPSWLAALVGHVVQTGGIAVGRTEPHPDQPRGPFSRTLHVTDDRFAQTCNVAYPADVVRSLGGFDEHLRTGEDTDLALRAGEHGVGRMFVPDALVHHDVSPSSIMAAARTATKWHDLPGVVARHPQVRADLAHRRIFWKASHPATIVAMGSLLGVAIVRSPLALLGVLPWLWQRARGRRITEVPGTFLVDATEVATMIRGSVKHRTLLL